MKTSISLNLKQAKVKSIIFSIMDFQLLAQPNGRFALSEEDKQLLATFITEVPNWRAYVGFILQSKSKLEFKDLAIKMRDFDFENTPDVENDQNGEDDEAGLEFTSMEACDCDANGNCRVCKHFQSVKVSSSKLDANVVESMSESQNAENDEDENSDDSVGSGDDSGGGSDDEESEYSSGSSESGAKSPRAYPGSPIKLDPSVSTNDSFGTRQRRNRAELVPLRFSPRGSSSASPFASPKAAARAPVQTQAAYGLNSHSQGKLGEQGVCSVLRKNLPFGFDVRACGATANSADIRVSCGRSIVLIDVKNYNTSKVSVNEQNKLINDVYRDPSVDGGIMLCVGKRGCTNISERFTMTKLHNTTDGTKPVLIVHTGDPDLITQSVLFMAMITAELRHIRGQSFDPDASEEEKHEIPNETRSLCVQALRKMTRIQTINDHADTIMQSACQIRSESTILKDELRNLFSGAGFVVGGDSSFDFNKKKFPKRYSEILRSMCEIKPPVLINRGARNVFDFGTRGFVRITTQKVTHSFSLDTPVSKWVDLVEHATKQQRSDSDSK